MSDVGPSLIRGVAHKLRDDGPVSLQLLAPEAEPATAQPTACSAVGYRPSQRWELKV
jgi:hypothetical protein